MKNEKKLQLLCKVVWVISTILVLATVALQLWAFEVIRHRILCCCTIVAIIVLLVFDRIMKEEKLIIYIHIFMCICFIVNLIGNLIVNLIGNM